jgi:hypothetical protein
MLVLVLLVGLIVSGCAKADRDTSEALRTTPSDGSAGEQPPLDPEVGDCLRGGSPKGPHDQFYLLSDLTLVPCSQAHQHEIYAPGYTVGGLGAVENGDECPSPKAYVGWTDRPAWQPRLAATTIVSALKTTGSPLKVFCAYAVVEVSPAGQPMAARTTGSLRGAGSRPDAVAKFGACMNVIPEVGQGVRVGPCHRGRRMWLKGFVHLAAPREPYPGQREVLQVATHRCSSVARELTGSTDPSSIAIRLPSKQAWNVGWREAGCHVLYDAILR